MRGRLGAVVVALAAGSVGAAPASAGTYDVHACATPGGKFSNHSWAISVNGSQFARTSCSASDARPYIWVGSAADKLYNPGQGAAMTFTAPSGATIANFWLHRYLHHFNPIDGNTDREYLYTVAQLGGTMFESGGHQDRAAQAALGPRYYNNGESYVTDETVTRASFPALVGYRGNATFLRYSIGCYLQACALKTNGAGAAGAINAQIFGARVTVNDPTRPVIAGVAPTGLAAGGVVGGDEPLTFDATDNSGIKRAELVDVTDRDSKVVGVEDFACDYSYASPCPQATGARVVPSGLPAGPRMLVLRLTDAGGNETDSDRIAVDVGGPLNGTPASAAARLTAKFARNRRPSVTVGFRKRARIRGRLVDAAGAPIAGAVIQVLDRQLRSGTQYTLRGELTTGPKGRFSLMPGKGPARAIRFEYRSRRLLAAPSASDRVMLRVRAGVTLRIRPKRVAPGGRIRISGRLKGRPLPHSGKVVDLQAFEAGRWRTFDTVRARKRARFSTTYRFVRSSGGRTIAFRACVRRDDSYPFYLGYSKRVRVRLG